MEDKLIQCPVCGSQLCYEYDHTQYQQWMCFSCGYGSTSHMVEGSDFVTTSKESLPELIKDLEFVDENKKVWYPSVVNIPEKGILFPNGSNRFDWRWAVAPLIKISKEEKSRFPKGQTHRVDLKKIEYFDKELYSAAITRLNSL